MHLLVTLESTLGNLAKVDQNQIIFQMIPKILCFEENILFTVMSILCDPMTITK